MQFLIGALILGLSVVFIAPFVLSSVSSVVPASLKPYFPAAASPTFSVAALVQAVVFGAIIMAILLLMSKVGIGKRMVEV